VTDLDVLADTTLRLRALDAAGRFIKEHDHPVSRAQVAGLRQIAANEPHLLPDFANKQKERADKRRLDSESAFWALVVALCNGTRPRFDWSLSQERDGAVPAELRLEQLPPGAKLAAADHAARNAKRARLREWLDRWTAACYPAFFQHFCAEYVSQMPPEDRRG
jgi:hypothetical protein